MVWPYEHGRAALGHATRATPVTLTDYTLGTEPQRYICLETEPGRYIGTSGTEPGRYITRIVRVLFRPVIRRHDDGLAVQLERFPLGGAVEDLSDHTHLHILRPAHVGGHEHIADAGGE